MKLSVLTLLIGICILSNSFTKIHFPIATQVGNDSMPELNKGIIAFVNANIHKKVGRGECWDLAAEPLNTLDAKWDKMYEFGKKVNYKRDSIFPGDIIQFEGVKVEYKTGNMTIEQVMDHHTAVIYEVHGIGDYVLAHQNTGDFGRKVGLSNLNLKNIITGRFTIYQPYR